MPLKHEALQKVKKDLAKTNASMAESSQMNEVLTSSISYGEHGMKLAFIANFLFCVSWTKNQTTLSRYVPESILCSVAPCWGKHRSYPAVEIERVAVPHERRTLPE